ncbi:MAG: DUF3131 domain-containing protein [Endomicrobiales bacterium]|nr:DUF3131 domain-containing protein [Endomicrobiales bacterium]
MRKTIALFLSVVLFLNGVSFAAKAPAKTETKQETVMVDDYEGYSQQNYLNGDRGSWKYENFDEENDPDSYCKEQVVKIDGLNGSKKALKLVYSVDSKRPSAMNGFWTKLINFDASKYDFVCFDVKGDAKEGFTQEFVLELKKYKDQTERRAKLTGMYQVKGITENWQTYKVPLSYFNGLYDKTNQKIWDNPRSALSDLDELVITFNSRGVTKKKGAIYIDNIKFLRTGEKTEDVFCRPPSVNKDKEYILLEDPSYTKKEFWTADKKGGYNKKSAGTNEPAKLLEYLTKNPEAILYISNGVYEFKLHSADGGKFRFVSGTEFMKFLSTRIGGFPKQTIVKKQFPADDNAMLKEIAKDTWKFFDNIVDKKHGLVLDTITLNEKEPMGEGSSIGDYTNVTNIGVYLCSVVSAYDFGFITKEDAIERLKLTLNTVKTMDTSKYGFPYNYYDTTWGTRTEYFISMVDSGWLVAGMYIVKNAFPTELGQTCEELINRGNFNFFYDNVEQQMWHGFYENMGQYVNYHYGIFYTEPRLTSFIAIAKGDVEKDHWFKMVRTFPLEYDWATQKPKHRELKNYKGVQYYAGWYEWKNAQGKVYKYIPSWGGSVFEALMPTLFLDEKKYAPKGLGLNDQNYVDATIDYTLNYLKYPVWGMSPSSDPKGGYSEFGVKPLGTLGYKPGAITPHASFLALEFAPKEAIKNIRKMLDGWDAYGEYGFYDALDPMTKKVAYKYLSLDQGMILLSLNNYLNNGAIKKRFEADPIFEKGKELLSVENLFATSSENKQK